MNDTVIPKDTVVTVDRKPDSCRGYGRKLDQDQQINTTSQQMDVVSIFLLLSFCFMNFKLILLYFQINYNQTPKYLFNLNQE